MPSLRSSLLALTTLGFVATCRPTAPLEAPRLVLVLVVDQMRADYLDRFADRLTGGFARLVENGAVFTDAHHDYAATETAPGHASIVTGLYPSHHGLVRNDWYDRRRAKKVYSVEDETAPIVDNPAAAGRSPANLTATTVGDWLKRRSPRSQVFSVAIKDRSAIAMGGKRPDGAYWYDKTNGHFVTSRYYRSAYPDWVSQWNAGEPAAAYHGRDWERLFPEETYRASREDDFPPESDGSSTTFPHWIGASEASGGWPHYYGKVLLRSPFADELTLRFARRLIEHEQLGADPTPDLLFLGLSAADYVGHAYGPYSQEVEDYYLRLDRQLDSLFTWLDHRVGRAEYAVVLTADHGVMPMPEELARRGVPAARVMRRSLEARAQSVLDSATARSTVTNGPSPAVHGLGGLVLAWPRPTSDRERAEAHRRVAEALRELPAVVEAYAYEELLGDDAGRGRGRSRPYLEAFRRSFTPTRSSDIVWLPAEHTLITNRSTETSHGTPYAYDTHVPLVFMGPGIAHRRDARPVSITTVAPTLAALLGLDARSGLDGEAWKGVGARR